MIVFDAGVLIAWLNADDAFHSAALAFMEENEDFDFAASTVTMAECLIRPTHAGRADEVIAAFDRLELIGLDLAASDAPGIARVRAETGLRMPDALVVFAAEHHSADIVTTDAALSRAAQGRHVDVHLL